MKTLYLKPKDFNNPKLLLMEVFLTHGEIYKYLKNDTERQN